MHARRTLRLSSAQERLWRRSGSFLPTQAPPIRGKIRCAFALRMFASGGCAVSQRVEWDLQVWVTTDHGFPLSGHASTFGGCAPGGTGEALRTRLRNCRLVASRLALALLGADPWRCGRHGRVAIETKRSLGWGCYGAVPTTVPEPRAGAGQTHLRR